MFTPLNVNKKDPSATSSEGPGCGNRAPARSRRTGVGSLLALLFIVPLLAAVGFLASAGPAYAAPIVIKDSDGADDEPGQKDLNQMSVDFGGPAGTLPVTWNWDDTKTSGANTIDACSLYDTDNDGFANFSLCVIANNADGNNNTDNTYLTTRLFSCNDLNADRCSGNVLLAEDTAPPGGGLVDSPGDGTGPWFSTCTSAVANTDPFHTTGPNRFDTVATCSVDLDDFGGASAFLLNVCSYPSQQPNSDPSDCVVTPNSGFLTIVKVDTKAGDTTNFTFNLGAGQASKETPPRTSFTIPGSGQIQLIPFVAGTQYDLTEVIPTGFGLDSASCVKSNGSSTGSTVPPPGDTVTDFEIQIGLLTTCTFTNSALPAKLKVIKTVINDNGGTAVAGDFTMNVTGGNPSPASFPGAVSPGTEVTLDAGANYSVGETGPTGYTQTNPDADCSGSIPAGQTKTCTITNDDKAATLIVKKVVTNDSGGTTGVTGFSYSVNGGTAVTFEADGENQQTVNAGTYTVTEPAVDGYATTYDNCTEVVIPNDGSATCTITNDDAAATLIVIKTVIIDDGGTAEAGDFTMNVTGTDVSDPSFPGAESPGTTVTLDAGSYSVTETAGPNGVGYTGTFSPDCSGTIANGQTKTCTVTNDDPTPLGRSAQIAPTATTCSQYRDGTAADLNGLLYGVKSGKINSVSPGVFFYYNLIENVLAGSTITVTQSDTSPTFPPIQVQGNNQVVLFNASTCTKIATGTQTNGTATIQVTATGTYIVGIKYDSQSLKGTSVTSPFPTVQYTFQTVGDPGSVDTINVAPKP